MTLGANEYAGFLSSSNKRFSGVIWLSLPLKDGETGFSSGGMRGTGVDRPSLHQDFCGLQRGRDMLVEPDPAEPDFDGLVPPFRVHGAVPRGVA